MRRLLIFAWTCCRTTLLSAIFVSGTSGITHAVTPAEHTVENELHRAVNNVLNAQPNTLVSLERLLKKVPPFHLAHLMKGDMYMVRAHNEVLWAHTDMLEKTRIAGLRAEAVQRLFFQPPPSDYLPTEVLSLSPMHRHILMLDGSRSRLYLFENVNGEPRLRANYYASIGAAGTGKQRHGDKKTPLGIYRITGWYDDKELAELYGAGAYPLNYPNAWDQLNQRDGSGIWVHGTPRAMYGRPPQDSRGCIVINNDILKGLRRLKHQPTLTVLTERSHWIPAKEWRMLREAMQRHIATWHADWESLDPDKYLAHYSGNYIEKNRDYTVMSESVRRNAKTKTHVSVSLANMDLFLYPGTDKLVLAVFDQDYRSNNFNLQYRKQQMWREENGELRIVSEGEWK